MRILLDTHIALWPFADDSRLKPTARALIETPVLDISADHAAAALLCFAALCVLNPELLNSSFAFAKFATLLLISPLGLALVLGLAAAVCRAARCRRLAGVLVAAGLLWLALWSTPWASHQLRMAMESRFPPVAPSALPLAQAIVVLGGAISPGTASAPLPNLHEAADRIWHAARLYRAGRAPLLVLSGGAGPDVGAASEAAAMQQLLLEWQISASAMLLEEHSRTTAENAQMTALLLRQRGITQVLLVTSALHMPRALALFRAQGLQVTPAATDHEGRDTAGWPFWQRWLPSTEALDGSARALKEWVGQRLG